MRDHRQRPDRARRHEHDVDGDEDAAGDGDRPREPAARCSTSSSPAAPTSPTRARSSSPAARRSATSPACPATAIPTIALVFGNSTAGGAYVPGMCDYVVMIEQRSKVFLGGPPLVKMATGEESDDESLGGADMHARVSGLADYFAVDELDALRIGRRIVRRLNHRKLGPPPRGAGPPARAATPSSCSASRRPTCAVPFDPRDVLARIVDDSDFDEFKPPLRLVARHRLGRAARLSDRRARQPPRRPVQRGVAQGGAVHPARQPDRHAAAVPAEHDRLHGRARSTSRGAWSRTARR